MTDAEIDTLSDELISEFTNLGKDFSLILIMRLLRNTAEPIVCE